MFQRRVQVKLSPLPCSSWLFPVGRGSWSEDTRLLPVAFVQLDLDWLHISQTNIQKKKKATQSLFLEGYFIIIHPIPQRTSSSAQRTTWTQKKVMNQTKAKKIYGLRGFQSPASQQEPVPGMLWPARNDFLLLLHAYRTLIQKKWRYSRGLNSSHNTKYGFRSISVCFSQHDRRTW